LESHYTLIKTCLASWDSSLAAAKTVPRITDRKGAARPVNSSYSRQALPAGRPGPEFEIIAALTTDRHFKEAGFEVLLPMA